jgi:hypothetical protein
MRRAQRAGKLQRAQVKRQREQAGKMTKATQADNTATAAAEDAPELEFNYENLPSSSFQSDNPRTTDPETGERLPLNNLLSSKRVIGTLTAMLLDKVLKPPFTVGIYGGWGTGKTFFLEAMRGEVEKQAFMAKDAPGAAAAPKPVTVMFEAWQHQADEDILVSMLHSAYQAILQRIGKEADDKFQVGKQLEASQPLKTKFAMASKVVAQTLASSVTKVAVGVPGLVNVEMSPAKAAERVAKFEEDYQLRRFTKKQQQENLKDSFYDALDVLAEYDDSGKQIKKGQPKRRIIFFIDDLDRCLPSVVVELLEKIKLFLWHPSCVFVIGIDHDQVRRAIDEYKGYKDPDIALRYLEKIINFPFHLPPISGPSYKKFIEDKIPESDYKADIVEVFTTACDERHASLRLMIQLANSFILNDYLVPDVVRRSGREYKPKVMAVLTALQVLHESVFSTICGSLAGREQRLQALFQEFEDPAQDPLEPLIGADSLLRFSKLRELAVEADAGSDDGLSCYVEFLVAQSSVSQADSSEPRILYVDKGMEWFAKDLPVSGSRQARISLRQTVDDIKSGEAPVGSMLVIDGYRWRLLHNDNNKKALIITEDIIGVSYLDIINDRANYKYNWENCVLKQELNSAEWLKKHLPLLSQAIWQSDDFIRQLLSDKVFLLSIEEAESYFKDESDRIAHLLGTNTDNWWWLRSPGLIAGRAASVSNFGNVYAAGDYVGSNYGGVRPALWLNLESEYL